MLGKTNTYKGFLFTAFLLIPTPSLSGVYVGLCRNINVISGSDVSFEGCAVRNFYTSEGGAAGDGTPGSGYAWNNSVGVCTDVGTTKAKFIVYRSEDTQGKWRLGTDCNYSSKGRSWSCKNQKKLSKSFDIEGTDCESNDDAIYYTDVKTSKSK